MHRKDDSFLIGELVSLVEMFEKQIGSYASKLLCWLANDREPWLQNLRHIEVIERHQSQVRRNVNAGFEQCLEDIPSGQAVRRENSGGWLRTAKCREKHPGCGLLRRTIDHGDRFKPGLLHPVVVARETHPEGVKMIV